MAESLSSGRPPAAAPGLLASVARWMHAIRYPRSARTVVLWLALYLTVAGNLPLWDALAGLGGAPSVYLPWVLVLGVLVFCGNLGLLALTAWSRGMKPVWLALVILSAVVQHYMLTYRMVMDPTMAANVLQTDVHEARDLLGWGLLANVLWLAAPVGWWLWRLRLPRQRLWPQLWRNAALLLAALAALAVGAVAMNRQLAPLMRNNVQLRYLVNPLASLYSTGNVLLRPLLARKRELLPITAGAALGPSYAGQARPPLLVLVVGETARADHFGLNGYGRDTTPELAARQVLSWRQVHSCGTHTLASVPCMFSHLGKQGYEARGSDYENLLDVLQAAGLAVLWVDNQGGCKDVCNRVPHGFAAADLPPEQRAALCRGDECLDEALLVGLDRRLAALPPERLARGVVLVLHQMGSHGPAYSKRSGAAFKRFLPECTDTDLAACSHSALINAYDNSIAYTDHFLARTIDWLGQRSDRYDTGMLYLSDHGESLGEYGLFLHGMPYSLAPEVQKHVPLVAWLGDRAAGGSGGSLGRRSALDEACLTATRDTPLTHDNLYHSVLGLMDVRSPTYHPPLDALAGCRHSGAPAINDQIGLQRPPDGRRQL